MFFTSSDRFPINGRVEKHLLAIGGVCWDHILAVADVTAGRKHEVLSYVRAVGGGAANHLLVQRALSPRRPLELVAGVGDDREGQDLRRHFAKRRIAMPWQPLRHVATSQSYVLNQAGTGTIFTLAGARREPLPLDLIEESLRGAAACALIAPPVNEQIAPILAMAARRKAPVYFGVGSMQVYKFGYQSLSAALVEEVELLILNRTEANVLVGSLENINDLLHALRFGGRVKTAVITDGANGIHAYNGGQFCHVPAYREPRHQSVDDTGAGDSAGAAIVNALLRDLPLELALRAGARAGYEATKTFGGATQPIDEVRMREYLSAWIPAEVA